MRSRFFDLREERVELNDESAERLDYLILVKPLDNSSCPSTSTQENSEIISFWITLGCSFATTVVGGEFLLGLSLTPP